jgi:RHS repeat-associated protein
MVQAGSNTACYEGDFEPYGREHVVTGTCSQHYKFTGKERDTETQNDYFPARFFENNLDRWPSPDPGGVNAVHLDDPQTWNMYAYVRNNPATLNDPTGLMQGDWGPTIQGYLMGASCQKMFTCFRVTDEPGPQLVPAVRAQNQLSRQSDEAIKQAATRYGYDAATFEKAITTAAAKYGINPNILVGLAYKESSLNPGAPHGGLFQIQPGRAKDLGIAATDIGSAAVQIVKVAGALAGAIKTFNGNVDLGIASWTHGAKGTQRLFSSGGMQAVSGACSIEAILGTAPWGQITLPSQKDSSVLEENRHANCP